MKIRPAPAILNIPGYIIWACWSVQRVPLVNGLPQLAS